MDRKQAKAIVNALLRDLEGRKGLGNEWEVVDLRERVELRNEWIDIIMQQSSQRSNT